MSEGPEVKIVADKILSSMFGKKIEDIIFKNLNIDIKNKIIGSKVKEIKTFGKNIVIKFSSGIYLRNHMMMWGKWRIYDRHKYDKGLAIPPKRAKWKKNPLLLKNVKDVREDSRVRLTIITKETVLVEFNGPILQFSIDNPSKKEPIKSLGPDCLSEIFDIDEAKMRLHTKQQLLISEALLDQKIISGIGNKYKSEILFICKISPFKQISQLEPTEENILLERIPKLLRYGYKMSGRTRPLLENEKSSWNTRHWVFRRTGKECWICRSLIKSEKTLTTRATFWCPTCQQ
ncbi:MAG TPA: DNA-formamidopyrimidine glycosylase family protein [Nitrososphaeraceae archaeon]|nr:DNA-formamidopyrimidine glycosylase family protein [Nitrososphaeraceae archaeon]